MFVKVHNKSDGKEAYFNFDNVLSIVPNPLGGSILILPEFVIKPNHTEVMETPAELAMAANNKKTRL